MAEPARILFAIPELGSGGPDRVFHELICGLDRAAFRPLLLVSRAGGRYFEALPQDVEACVIGGGRYPVWRFARAVDRLRPDLVLSTLRMNLTAAAALPLQRHRPPLIIRQANAIGANFSELRRKSGLKYSLAERVVRILLRVPDALVAQSSDMATELARHTVPTQRIAVIGNPVSIEDVAAARACCAAQAAGAGRGEPSLVAVGRLATQKGFDMLLPAFAALLPEYPDAVLTILGEGPERAALEAQAERLGIRNKVHMAGQSDSVLAEVAAADLFISSSRYEGFSNALLEAMALGKPVVATNSEGGTRDMVIDGQTGILVDPVTVEALTEGLRRGLRADRAKLGDAGRSHVGSRYSRERILTDYAVLFDAVLAVAGGRRGQCTLAALAGMAQNIARKGDKP